ncbi:MAG: glycosyltransferase family 2 protein [Eubacteriales bacterium]|nr:glycosyltransferase family 2 protein [Eubacteriales bacterium]
MKILAIIPAYNEGKTIRDVILDIKRNVPEADILVVNDGSRDNTLQAAKEPGVYVADLPFNLGIGAAMQTGYIFARDGGYDFAVQVDGDGQHSAACIYELLEPLLAGNADMVIGSRYMEQNGYKSSAMRRIGAVFFSLLIKIITGQSIKDTTSGFRAANREIIKCFAEYYPSDYPEVEVIAKLHKLRKKIAEVPVKMRIRIAGISSITPIRSVYYILKVSLSLFIGTLRFKRQVIGRK